MLALPKSARFWLQVGLAGLVAGLILLIGRDVMVNLERQSFAFGFDFLSRRAGFSISQTLIFFDENSTFARAFLVGLSNTLLVAGVGLVLSTMFGGMIGFARLSSNKLIAIVAAAYVEIVRNVPLLLVLFLVYFGMLRNLPPPRASLDFLGVMVNNRGLFLPALDLSGGTFGWDWPHLLGFSVTGGIEISPEFVALLFALSIYTAAYIAEIVRAGILSVSGGQVQAAQALGLSPMQTSRFIVMPLALRLILPPLTSQYLNLIKNSSLGVAIAYPDLVSVFTGTALAQTGRALEIVSITMAVYLSLSVITAAIANKANSRRWAR